MSTQNLCSLIENKDFVHKLSQIHKNFLRIFLLTKTYNTYNYIVLLYDIYYYNYIVL